jgi:hypothetical protein
MSSDLAPMSNDSGCRLTNIGLMLVQFVLGSIDLAREWIFTAVRSTDEFVLLVDIAVVRVVTAPILIEPVDSV